MNQGNLFDRPIPPERIAAAHEAADHADRVHGGDWFSRAMDYVVSYVRAHVGCEFLAEDIRCTAVGSVPTPPDNRAWGAVIHKASKAGVLVGTGAYRLDMHGSPKPVYRG